MLYKIYILINPIDRKIFYVGVTKGRLKDRLSGHCIPNNTIYEKECFFKRKSDLIALIKENGLRPEIICLKEVEFSEVDYYEKFYYDLLSAQGCILIQDPKKFRYTVNKKSLNIYK